MATTPAIRARQLLNQAIARGEIVRGACEQCGDKPTHGHHRWGYADPLRVVWLCAPHHRREHAKLTWAKVCEIRALGQLGVAQRTIAAQFGVSQVAVHFVLAGRSWREKTPRP